MVLVCAVCDLDLVKVDGKSGDKNQWHTAYTQPFRCSEDQNIVHDVRHHPHMWMVSDDVFKQPQSSCMCGNVLLVVVAVLTRQSMINVVHPKNFVWASSSSSLRAQTQTDISGYDWKIVLLEDCKVNHRLMQLSSVAVLCVAMGVTGCRVWGSLPCAAWCLLRCHWPEMISSVYPLQCLLREAYFLLDYYACIVPPEVSGTSKLTYDIPPNGKDQFI